jgi:hypothetical protein
MKKLIISLGVIIAFLGITPFLIKDLLIKKELKKVRQDEGFTVSYSRSKMCFSSFPIISVALENVEIDNESYINHSQVANIKEVVLSLSLFDLVRDVPTVESIKVNGGSVNLLVDEKGNRNFDFITSKGTLGGGSAVVKQILINDLLLGYIDKRKKMELTISLNKLEWLQKDSVSIDLELLLKQLSIDGNEYYTNRRLKVISSGHRLKGGFRVNQAKVEFGALIMFLEQKSKVEWHVFSKKAHLEDYFELLPEPIHPRADYSSNTPLVVDLSIKRNKISAATIVANHITLTNKGSEKKIDEINFNYKFKKRSSEFSDVIFRGLGSTLTGSFLSKGLKENDVLSTLRGDVDVQNLVNFFFENVYLGSGNVKFSTDVSKRIEKLEANINVNVVEVLDNNKENVFFMDGEILLTAKKLMFENIIINSQKKKLIISGVIQQPINYFLLNNEAVSGAVSLSSSKTVFFNEQYEDVNLEFEFGFVPSKKYLYITGLPIDPLVSPSFLRIKSCDFIQPGINKERVHLAMVYDTGINMHLKEFLYQVGDTVLQIEVISKKPNNLALFAFEKQSFWLKCKYDKFSLKAALNRLGVQSNRNELISGLFQTNVGYKPTQLLSGGKLNDVEFNQLSVDLLVDDQPLVANGTIKYEGKKLQSEVSFVKGNSTLLDDLLRAVF